MTSYLQISSLIFSNHRPIYRIFLALVSVLFFLPCLSAQEIGAYKTLQSGDFSQLQIWAIWDGIRWTTPSQAPNSTHDVYVDKGHTLRLTKGEAVKNIYLHAGTGAAQKLNLNGNNLDVYGSLAAFSGNAPGSPRGAWNSKNWIGNSETSTITFRGISRNIVSKESWSAQTTQSRFSVVFDPFPGSVLVLLAPLKALSFQLKSGTLIQKKDTAIQPTSCFTLSFNTEASLGGTGSYGTFRVGPGATFISECDANILHRSSSGSDSAELFELQKEGLLVLQGETPKIEASTVVLEGKVLVQKTQGPSTFLSSTFPNSAKPKQIRHLELQSEYPLDVPTELTLLGNLQKSGTGDFDFSDTRLKLSGESDQEILGFELKTASLILDKPSGIFYPRGHVRIERDFEMKQGNIDFEGHELELNASGLGKYSYHQGAWKNVSLLTYAAVPSILDSLNATFPFADRENGGLRKFQLLGPSNKNSVTIQFIEKKGANHDPNFNDLDGTPILYQLHSHFILSSSPTPESEEVEVRISASGLVVTEEKDLRIVSVGKAVEGTHLTGMDKNILWARRRLSWQALVQAPLTVGSFMKMNELSLTPKTEY
ncbi:MAG: hypothetical protein ACKO44_08490 [Algoriphagus sp.]